jgi:hypothetical protein
VDPPLTIVKEVENMVEAVVEEKLDLSHENLLQGLEMFLLLE